MRTFNGDQNTTASQSHFFEDPIDPEADLRSEDDLAQMMNQSAVPMNDYSDPLLERLMRSQALSQHSEMQLDKAVNRLFDDAGRKKMKLEKMRMENLISQLSATKATPSINSMSQKISSQRRKLPIHRRVEELQEHKKTTKSRLRLEHEERERASESELTFKPTINAMSQRLSSSKAYRALEFHQREKIFQANKDEANRLKQQ